MNYGLDIAWVTGNRSASVEERAKTLGICEVYQGSRFKSTIINEIATAHALSLDQIAYIGDDLNDLPAFDTAGFCFAPDNAVEEVKARADVVTSHAGGHGAVREAIETILKAQGKWDNAVACFLAELEQEDAGKQGPEAVA